MSDTPDIKATITKNHVQFELKLDGSSTAIGALFGLKVPEVEIREFSRFVGGVQFDTAHTPESLRKRGLACLVAADYAEEWAKERAEKAEADRKAREAAELREEELKQSERLRISQELFNLDYVLLGMTDRSVVQKYLDLENSYKELLDKG